MAESFLLEIGVEEMPARFVDGAREELRTKIKEWLKENRLDYEEVRAFSTPRRLAVMISGLAEKQADMIVEARGPALAIAKDEDGSWTKAAKGFARGKGIDVEQLEVKETSQGTYVFAVKKLFGKDAKELLPDASQVLITLNFPKSMRWGKNQLRFVRPIHWLVALYGPEVIPSEIAGIKSGRVTQGHRFLGDSVHLTEASEYVHALLKSHVLVDSEERKMAIRRQLEMLAEAQGWEIGIEESLLTEVNNLVEYPTVLFGTYEERFLALPDQVLITTMREHQRYFSVSDKKGNLLPYFVTVRNGDHMHLENVQKGNEKVLRARLSDAVFFYEEDKKQSLEHFLKKLDKIVEQERIGSLGDKANRTIRLSRRLAKSLNIEGETLQHVERAAQLLKFDLTTHMVDEFPELQGVMGAEYAQQRGEAEAVYQAVAEHYLPRYTGDDLPASLVGALVSVADKWDTIYSSFSIGLKPTGSQDPYGLRRQAAAIVQIANRYQFGLSFEDMLEIAAEEISASGNDIGHETVAKEIEDFFALRLKTLLAAQAVSHDVIDAILLPPYGRIDVLVAKADLLQTKHESQELREAVETLSRVNNIAIKADGQAEIDPQLFEKEAESRLYDAYVSLKQEFSTLLETGEIEAAWERLVALSPTIHDYFDEIMVMSEDEHMRKNRLQQMYDLSKEIKRFAQFQSLVLPSPAQE